MLVQTPLADFSMRVDKITIKGKQMIMDTRANGGLDARVTLDASDIRRVFAAFIRPKTLVFLLMSLLAGKTQQPAHVSAIHIHHPTSNPW